MEYVKVEGRLGAVSQGGWAQALALYVVVYSAFFDTHAQMPILGPFAAHLGATPWWIGLVVGAYSFTNILGNGISGVLMDRLGWRRPLLMGLLGAVVALFAYTQVTSVPVLLAVRLAHGLAGGVLVPATLAAIIGAGEQLGSRPMISRYGAAIGLAALTGPPVAGLLAGCYGYAGAYLGITGIMLMAFLSTLLVTKPNQGGSTFPDPWWGKVRELSSSAWLLGACLLAFTTMGATGTLFAFFPLRVQALGQSATATGLLFGCFAATAILTQLAWTWVPERWVQNTLWLVGGESFLVAGMVAVALGNTPMVLAGALILFGGGFGMLFPNMLRLVVAGSGPRWRGTAIGLFFVCYSLGVVVIPPLGALAWQFNPALTPFLSASAIVSGVLPVIVRLCNSERQ